MNKRITITLLLVLSLASCEQVDELTQFEMDYTTSFTIPGTIGMDVPFDLHTPEIQTNSEEKFSGQDTRKDLVEEIVLQEMNLSIQSPSDGDFSFLNGLTIYLSAEGMEEIKVAWKDSIPENPGSTLQLETATADLKDYIFKDQFQLRLQSRTDEIIDQDHEVRVESVFFVDAEILGQ
ncbi:MAG TPA: hypothetical protein VJ876_01760 [Bacteroidales bacterium]|nr:hypothetical protein [Bacteroidales bacterium]